MSKLEELIEKLCPNGVKFKNLQYLCETITTGKLNANAMEDNGLYPFFTCDSNPFKINTYAFDEEAILISGNGSQVGHINYYKGKFNAYQRTYVIYDFKEINVKFLLHYLNGYLKEYILRNCKKGSVPYITLPMLQKFSVPVPPLEVQCEIIHILDDFTLLSAELSAELKARQKQYNFYKDKIFNISEKTNYVEIKDILQEKGYIRGPFGSALRKSDMVKNGVPIYEQQHAIYNHRNFRYFISNEKANALARFMVKYGDIILSCSGTVGRTSIIKSVDEKGIINQALLILRVDPNKINVRFLEHFLKSSYGRKKILSNTNGSAQVNICKREEFEKIKIPLPKMDEQNEIVNILDRFDKLCNDISDGLPAEIEARQKQYEYYRDKLLTFKELKVNE